MKKILLLLSLFFTANIVLQAQIVPNLQWANRLIGSPYYDLTLNNTTNINVKIDKNGNLFTLGVFALRIDTLPNANGGNVNSIPGGTNNTYIVKYAPNGAQLWVKCLQGYGYGECYGMDLDSNGNIYIIGTGSFNTDFDPGSGIINKPAINTKLGYVLKLDNDGNYMWCNNLRSANEVNPLNISIDGNQNLIITGCFKNYTFFDSTTNHLITPVNSNANNLFILKLNTSGIFQWVKTIETPLPNSTFTTNTPTILKVAKNGDFYVAIIHDVIIDIDFSTSVQNIIPDTIFGNPKIPRSLILVKYDSNANFLGYFKLSPGTMLSIEQINLDSKNNLILNGIFVRKADLNPDPAVADSVSSTSLEAQSENYILKLNSSFQYKWAKSFNSSYIPGLSYPSPVPNGVNDLVIDKNDNLFAIGTYYDRIDFDPKGTHLYHQLGQGSSCTYLTKIDSAGNLVWASSLSNSGDRDPKKCENYGHSIAVDDAGFIYTTGYVFDTLDMDPGPKYTTFGFEAGKGAPYISKLKECNATPITITAAATNLTANQTGTYQWVQCDTIIKYLNKTTQTFTPTQGGNYAVIVTSNGCSNISPCTTFYPLAIDASQYNQAIEVYPNPVLDNLHIAFGITATSYQITITNTTGQIVKQVSGNHTLQVDIDTKNLQSGIYYAHIVNANCNKMVKFIKN
jgi:hypothetical protein